MPCLFDHTTIQRTSTRGAFLRTHLEDIMTDVSIPEFGDEADTEDLLDVEDQDTDEEFSVYGAEYRDDV